MVRPYTEAIVALMEHGEFIRDVAVGQDPSGAVCPALLPPRLSTNEGVAVPGVRAGGPLPDPAPRFSARNFRPEATSLSLTIALSHSREQAIATTEFGEMTPIVSCLEWLATARAQQRYRHWKL